MTRRTLYLESFAGIAGDLFTAAFLDAGLVDPEAIRAVPDLIGAPQAKVEISDVEREKIMAEITRSFVSHAASYGFSLEEISSYLRELSRGE